MKLMMGIIFFSIFSISYANETDLLGVKIGSHIKKYNDITLINESNTAYKQINFKGFKELMIFYTPKSNIISKLITLKGMTQDCLKETKKLADELTPILGEFKANKIFKEYSLENEDKTTTIYCNNKNIVLEIKNNKIETNRNIELAQETFLDNALIKINEQIKEIERLNTLTNEERLQYLRTYRDDVYAILYKNWTKPSHSIYGWSCTVRVTQNNLGVVLNLRIFQCKDDTIFQKSIKDAILRSSPLPLPKHSSLFNNEVELKFKVTE